METTKGMQYTHMYFMGIYGFIHLKENEFSSRKSEAYNKQERKT